MRYLPLLAGLLACGPALAQSVPPRITAPTDPTQAVNLAYLNSALATAAANAANAANLSSGVLSAARLPTGPGGVPILDSTGKVPLALIPAGSIVAATATTLGGIKCGTGLLCASDGMVSVDSQVPAAAAAVPAVADLRVLLQDGTYLTGPQLKTVLGVP